MSDMMSQGWFGFAGERIEDSKGKKAQKAEAAANDAQAKATADAAAAQTVLDDKKKKASALLDQPTGGFASGAQTARQFLTSF